MQELVGSDGFSEVKVDVVTSFLLVKNCLNYQLNYRLKHRLQVIVDHRERDLMLGMLLLSMKTNELSRHMLEIRWFTVEI